MILPALLLALQAPAAPQKESPADTAHYANAAVRSIVERAAELNRLVPSGLGGYRVAVESEIALTLRLRGGAEAEGSIEQVAADVSWDRTGAMEQRITGYRAMQVGPSFSALSYVQDAWVVPSLYGNRLSILFGVRSQPDSANRGNSGRSTTTTADTTRRRVSAVHPLAADRELTYRYDGGERVQTLFVDGREIRIVRVNVSAREDLEHTTTVFEGEMDLDADRFHVVRLRGSFSTRAGRRERPGLLASGIGPQGVIYVELVNSELNQQWWLPSTQRFEAQVTSSIFGDTRAIFRILTRFGEYAFTPMVDSTAAADTLRAQKHRLTYAPQDSISQFGEWSRPIGALSSQVAAADFDDVAPELFRYSGRPQLLIQPERLYDIVHVNRVEGLFTGLGATVRMRDAAPGVLVRGVAGYAWSEEVVRWRAMAEWERNQNSVSVRVGRQLDVTNKFLNGLDSASFFVSLFGDNYFDYVDRHGVSAQYARAFQSKYGSAMRFDAGLIEDRQPVTNYAGWPMGKAARENRGVTAGEYARSGVTFEWRPRINGEFLRPGVGARVRYERGDGDVIRYERVELLVGARNSVGPFSFAARLDAGATLSDEPPPQQLFEIGQAQGMRAYGVNEFAGDRAVLVRSLAMYSLPFGRAPLRFGPTMWLPSPSPAIAVSFHSGWADASSDAARLAIEARGQVCSPTCEFVARPSDGWKSTVVVGMRFFGGVVSVGAAKPLDGRGWRGVFQVGGQL
jgi:hypothetical protein